MASPVIEVRGLAELARRLDIGDFKNAVNAALIAGAETAKAIVATYPTQRVGRKQPFKTDKSRRWFFANLRSGKIRVPYRRTGNLGRKWTTASLKWNKVRIGNNTPYAQLVQHRKEQTRFHKAGKWRTTDDIAEQDEGKVVKEIERGIENYLRNI